MKKATGTVFIVVCMVICLIPFAGMTFFRTDTTTENKTLASFPKVMEEGTVNLDFFDELSDYFEDHFAFREYLVNADALIQSKVFQVSNVDTVIVGEDGWLYYSATLDDYLGQDLMSEREIYNAAHNIALLQTYVEEQGAQFAVTVAPNKNTLYGENMPYYDSYTVSDERNIEYLEEQFEAQGVSYIDLFSVFENEDEVLYLKRDSHWNAKGAVLAYNTILNSMDISHDSLSKVSANRSKTEIGDQNTMVYPLTAEPEWNYNYEYDVTYEYVTETSSVEDAWIMTSNDSGEGSLLMFRDSFGNTLLPLMANTFSQAYFSKGTPYMIGNYMQIYAPEVVIVEKVERNIDEFASTPPVMQGIETVLESVPDTAVTNATCNVAESESAMTYISVNGILEDTEDLTNVYIRLGANGVEETYEAFLVTTEESDYGYQLYLSKTSVAEAFAGAESSVDLEVITQAGENLSVVYTDTVDFSELVAE